MKNSFLVQARDGNKTALLKQEIIRLYISSGNFSIPNLSREMNMSVPTITKLIRELMDEGFVEDFGKQGNNGGRLPSIYGLKPDAGYFVGVDFKQETMDVGTIDFKGQMIDLQTASFTLENSDQSLDEFCRIVNSIIDKVNVPREKILAIGVNLSGRVNSETGYSYSYYFLGEQPLTALLEERLGCSVFIDNDSRAMAYGEYMCTGARGTPNMLFINASWGLGMGMILGGKLFYGKSGFSGEFGHFPFFNNEVICRCGKRGCLETGASGSAVHRLFIEKLKEGRVSVLSEKYAKDGRISLEDITGAVNKEDVLAIEIMEQIGSDLGKATSGLINMFNPELIVVGGTLSDTGDYLLLPLRSAINKYSLTLVSRETDVRLSKLGDMAGVIGACMLVRSKTLNLL
jgi:predicted NBD/HSP70 family sugar kinase/predicted transcriptional regulator